MKDYKWEKEKIINEKKLKTYGTNFKVNLNRSISSGNFNILL